MEAWEPGAREAIRELVARYTHLGDGGRIKEMTELFEPDAVVEAIGIGTPLPATRPWRASSAGWPTAP